MKNILVTGAAGFIGSTFVREALTSGYKIVVLDKLTYAGHLANLEEVREKIEFVKGDIADSDLVGELLNKHKIEGVFNLAAESHVDNSILGPAPFIETNIVGTFRLVEATRNYWRGLDESAKTKFRFLHVSTDEVFGSLGDDGLFTEESPYQPNSPYSATKAGSDHLVRAWFHTYGLPTIITNCSNNYGPRQFPEKLIPRMIDCALQEKPLPVYGQGLNVRDWIHVSDHARGLLCAFERGEPGGTYCFGGNAERKNIEIVNLIANIFDEVKPRANKKSYKELITFVEDRAGHDWRYAIDSSKAESQLSYKRQFQSFEEGLHQTVKWYLANSAWMNTIKGVKK
jgi:dTDP-glucose 4,6-dehydratase